MKLTKEDNSKLELALKACKLAEIDLAVIHEGKIRGMNDSKTAAIISGIDLTISPDVKWGITRLGELTQRIHLFSEYDVEGELTGDQKVKKIIIRGGKGNSKIDFRCTDIALLEKKYPKNQNETAVAVIHMKQAEVALLSKGVKTLGATQVTIQVKRDGQVHIESSDSSNDRFEFDLETSAEFTEDPVGMVNAYDTSNTGVILQIIEHMSRNDDIDLVLNASGIIGLRAYDFDILAIPRIDS